MLACKSSGISQLAIYKVKDAENNLLSAADLNPSNDEELFASLGRVYFWQENYERAT